MNTGQIIKLVRITDKIGQGDLADMLNVSRTYLSQIENGRKQPSLSFLKKFSKQFSVPLPLLFLGEQTHNINNEILTELRGIFAKLLVIRSSNVNNNFQPDLFNDNKR